MDPAVLKIILTLIGVIAAAAAVTVMVRIRLRVKSDSSNTNQTGNVVHGDQAGRDINKK